MGDEEPHYEEDDAEFTAADSRWARRPTWHRRAWDLMRSYERLQDRAELYAEERGYGRGVERKRRLLLRYINEIATRKARELHELVRNPPRWTEERGTEFVQQSKTKYDGRIYLFEQIFGDDPHVRRDYMSAEDREKVLATIADPEARSIVAILTSKTGVALRAAHAVGKLRARVRRNADDNWNPNGARAQALITRYKGDALFSYGS